MTRQQAAADPNLSIVGDSVYDVRAFRNSHPGGSLFVSLFGNGRDATDVFLSYHRRQWPAARMEQFKVATLVDRPSEQDPLYLQLAKEVSAALPNGGFAPWWYYVKVGALVGGAMAIEYQMLKDGRTAVGSFVQGLCFAWIGLNIQHDANHGAISKHSCVNRLLGLTQDWIGGSSILWLQEHDVLHHPLTNDLKHDPDIEGAPIFRMRPNDKVEPWHKLQHVYILPLELLYGWTPILRQIGDLWERAWAGRPVSKLAHPWFRTSEVLKAAFLVRFLGLPLYREPTLRCMSLITLTTCVGGLYLAFFFALSHNFNGVKYFDREEEDRKGIKPVGFLEKQVTSSSSVGGRILGFFNGGLNYQIEHHLFPRVHHSHYPTIAPIVREYCAKHNINYVFFPTVWGNLKSMLEHLKIMGTKN